MGVSEHDDVVGWGLLEAISQTLQVVTAGVRERSAVCEAFRCAVSGLRAERAFLARSGTQPETLDVIDSRGMSARDINAVRLGRSAMGLSASVIQRVLTTGRTQYVADSRVSRDLERTVAFLDTPCSVICAAVPDPHTRLPVAVVYFQTASTSRPLPAAAVPHVNAYAAALGSVWGALRAGTGRSAQRGLSDDLTQARHLTETNEIEILGRSQQTEALRLFLSSVVIPSMSAPCPDPILVLGPTGSGKEVVARYLHRHSARSGARFVALNCATFKGEILEAKLFGHVKGAFTGAATDSEGMFVAAHKGVLFLDEVGDMPEDGQVMLLRALETRSVRPVGGRDERSVDVLVICATNVDLEQAVRRGKFRADLYHRINGLSVRVVALQDRPDDVMPLLAYYLAHHERRLGRRTRGLTPEAAEVLQRYAWPGNVRELARACSALVLHAAPDAWLDLPVVARALPHVMALNSHDVEPSDDDVSPFVRNYGSLPAALRSLGRRYLLAVHRRCRGNRTIMARYLRVPRSTLYRALVRYGLEDQVDNSATKPADGERASPDTFEHDEEYGDDDLGE